MLGPKRTFAWRLLHTTSRLRYCASCRVETVASVSHEVSAKQQLFITDPISPGSIFFLPNGVKIFNKLVKFMKLQQQNKYGFQEVMTPLIYRKSLWEQSGHWENYKEDMFRVEGQDLDKEEYGLKPMNCPGHCVVFKRFARSYSELPLRFSDFSALHRNEASGALTGLTRVRKFHQDDGHIFCTPDQVESEITKSLELVDLCYSKIFLLGPNNSPTQYSLRLSTRPEHYIGDSKVWDLAEDVLRGILEKSNKEWAVNEGDGAFYGPKIDVLLKDHNGKSHQVATIQLDFNLPERFDLKFKDKDNTYKRPIMIHRAVFGSLERFMAMLIDSNGGKWPFWLNPHQCMVIPLKTNNKEMVEKAKEITKILRGENVPIDQPVKMNTLHFNVDIDDRAEPVGYRIKDAIMRKYSYLIMVGAKEIETGKFAVRTQDSRELSHLTVDEIFSTFAELEQNYM
ncbi:LANO_0G12574g1_1 [Lachancea nothofagi CBS 11611]|uniref:threonine--tRNA ligase n=1 Tax=Lachancea nothofagi CBS 11611 TaxID=1266666 RepID=A0A1G4KJU6_9SACH|nr:LANO_0G12574g1_1 [Lachancea nothofagi CBS 11611]